MNRVYKRAFQRQLLFFAVFIPFLCLLFILCPQWNGLAYGTDLPVGLLHYLYQEDSHVVVRFDGLITFSNGQQYLPVIPQIQKDSSAGFQVVQIYPSSKQPDLIRFKNNWFLIRLVKTNTGKISLARLMEYPIEMKEGILPQDFVMPENLYVPSELKVILGDLPYKAAASNQGTSPSGLKSSTTLLKNKSLSIESHPGLIPSAIKQPGQEGRNITLYVANLNNETLSVIHPGLDQLEEQIPLNCVPSSMSKSPDKKSLYITCTTSNEILVLDTDTNLIKTRVKVNSSPSELAVLPPVAILTDGKNKVEKKPNPLKPSWLQVNPFYNSKNLNTPMFIYPSTVEKRLHTRFYVPLKVEFTGNCPLSSQPANASVLQFDKRTGQPLVAATSNDNSISESERDDDEKESPPHQFLVSYHYDNHLTLIDGDRLKACSRIEIPGPGGVMYYSRRFKTLFVADASDPKVYEINPDSGILARTLSGLPSISGLMLTIDSEHHPYLWILSRSKAQVGIVDLVSGQPIKLLGVGKKPVDWVLFHKKLYVLSALDDRIDVIDADSQTLQAPIPLPAGTYGTAITLGPEGVMAYISSVGTEQVGVVNLRSGVFEKSIPIDVKGIAISLIESPEKLKESPGGSGQDRSSAGNAIQAGGSPDKDSSTHKNKVLPPMQYSKPPYQPASNDSSKGSLFRVGRRPKPTRAEWIKQHQKKQDASSTPTLPNKSDTSNPPP